MKIIRLSLPCLALLGLFSGSVRGQENTPRSSHDLAYIGHGFRPCKETFPDSGVYRIICLDLQTRLPCGVCYGAGTEHFHIDTLHNLLWALNRIHNSFDAVDLESFSLVRRVPVEPPEIIPEGWNIHQVCYDDARGMAYLRPGSSLCKIDLTTGSSTRIDSGYYVDCIDLHSSQGKMYIVEHVKGGPIVIVRYDLDSWEKDTLFFDIEHPVRWFKVSPSGDRMLVICNIWNKEWKGSYELSAETWSLEPEPLRLDSTGARIPDSSSIHIRYSCLADDLTFMAFNFTGHRKQYIWNILEPGEESLKDFDFLPGWDGPITGYTDISGARRTLLSPGAISVAAIDPYNSEVAIPPLDPFTGETVRDTFIEDITPKADRADTSVTYYCNCNGPPYHCIINPPEIYIRGLAAGSGVPPLAGDTNRDGSRNIFDLLEMLQLITDPDPADYGRGDLDYNGKVDIFDLLALLRLLKS
ncbi:MAG: hypothetical protein U9P14_11780 [Gemmatimonadota bacterium]|nr:hypothetical protein [Gemmatimonadota bacterium]